MKRRFAVYDDTRTFAFVHALDAASAIRIACEKVKGHDPATATAISTDDGSGRRSAGRFGHPESDND